MKTIRGPGANILRLVDGLSHGGGYVEAALLQHGGARRSLVHECAKVEVDDAFHATSRLGDCQRWR